MKNIKLGKSKTEVSIMNAEEVKKFLSDKTVYHHVVHWIEKWKNKDLLRYFPYAGFTLPSSVTLKPHEAYRGSKQCLGHRTTTGKPYWTYNRYKIKIREKKSGTVYYVTKMKK